MRYLIVLLFVILCDLVQGQNYNFKELQIVDSERIINLQAKCPDVVTILKVQNIGKKSENKFYYALSNENQEKVVTVLIEGKDKKEYTGVLLEDLAFKAKFNATLIEFTLENPISPSSQTTIKIKELFIKRWVAYPTHIELNENQYIKFYDNKYLFTPYSVLKQKTIYHTNGIEQFQENQNLVKLSNSVQFEEQSVQSPFRKEIIFVHILNNNAFPILSKSEKTIEVSHWGNIAISYFNKLYNDGAKLKGEFGRVSYSKYNPNNGKNAVKQLYAEIPYHAWGAFYFDEIGNISTSHAWRDSGSKVVRFQFEPRFPILGGWKSNFNLGYNLPPQKYLYQNITSGQFILKQKFYIDIHDLVTEDYSLKVILPEGAYDITYDLPFEVDSQTQEKTFSYLDTQGRPTLVFKKQMVSQFHNQYFQVYYRLETNTQWRKGFLLFSVFMTFFLLLISINRLELSSFSQSEEKAKEQKK